MYYLSVVLRESSIIVQFSVNKEYTIVVETEFYWLDIYNTTPTKDKIKKTHLPSNIPTFRLCTINYLLKSLDQNVWYNIRVSKASEQQFGQGS